MEMFHLESVLACVGAMALTVMGVLWRSNWILRRENQRLREGAERRSELAQEVAHELKNPITAILCSVDTLLLLLRKSLAPEHLRCLQYVRDYGDTVLRLVTDFIDITRYDDTSQEPKPEPVLLQTAVEACVGLLAAQVNAKEIELVIDPASSDLAAWIDPKHLKQIVFNLTHNAVKFTAPRGRITVRLSAEHGTESVRLEVEDTGAGISAVQIRALKGSVQPSGLDSYRGLGLGLRLTTRLVELANGTLDIESSIGQGTRFVVTIPKAESAVVRISETDRTTRPLAGKRILVVHPEAAIGESITKLIGALGAAAEHVREAADAVTAVTAGSYTTVLMDESAMPHPSTICDELHAVCPRVLIAYAKAPEPEAVAAAHAHGWVAKPLSESVLVRSLAVDQS